MNHSLFLLAATSLPIRGRPAVYKESTDQPKMFKKMAVGQGGDDSERQLLPDDPSKQNQHFTENISTKPSILGIMEKLKAGGLDTSTLPGPKRIIRSKNSFVSHGVERHWLVSRPKD